MKRRQIDFLPADGEARREEEPKGRKGRNHDRHDRTSRWTPADIPDRNGGQTPAFAKRGKPDSPVAAAADPAKKPAARLNAATDNGKESGGHGKKPYGWFQSESGEKTRQEHAETAPHTPEAPRSRPRSWEEMYLEPSEASRPRRFEEMREQKGPAGGEESRPATGDRERKRPGRYGMTTNALDASGRPRRNKIAPRPGKAGKSNDRSKRTGDKGGGKGGGRPKR